MTPSRHADRARRARRLPADRRPGGLRRGQPPRRSASRSTARPTARRSCSRSPTPTSRRPSCAGRRARSTRRRGAATPAPRAPARPARRSRPASTLDFPLETATVADLQAKLTAGTLNAVTLTKAYLQRIALTNTEGPSINAVRAINPKALEEAAELDAERAAGHVRGPLHGIPVIVKDNLDAAGMPTTAGSRRAGEQRPRPGLAGRGQAARRGRDPARQAQPVRVRELPHQRPMPSGYSSLGGQVLNPYNADITPSGSRVGLRRRGGRRPGGDHDRHRDLRLDRLARRRRRASSACGPRSASCRAPASCRSAPRRTRPGR